MLIAKICRTIQMLAKPFLPPVSLIFHVSFSRPGTRCISALVALLSVNPFVFSFFSAPYSSTMITYVLLIVTDADLRRRLRTT